MLNLYLTWAHNGLTYDRQYIIAASDYETAKRIGGAHDGMVMMLGVANQDNVREGIICREFTSEVVK